MPNFERFVTFHGELGVQAIIERLERYDGIRTNICIPLEDRWNALMQGASAQEQLAA